MTRAKPDVVFDAVVLVKSIISNRGTSAACIEAVRDDRATLHVSDAMVAEVVDVVGRPNMVRRFPHVTPSRIDRFREDVRQLAIQHPPPHHVFDLPRDPKDEPYTDLASAVNATYLVTWNDKHLTYLMRQTTPEGRDFCARFPFVTILTPPDFLRRLDPPTEDAASPE
jgi:putative PIN family toxin of toxin-antitoxin system